MAGISPEYHAHTHAHTHAHSHTHLHLHPGQQGGQNQPPTTPDPASAFPLPGQSLQEAEVNQLGWFQLVFNVCLQQNDQIKLLMHFCYCFLFIHYYKILFNLIPMID